MSSREDLRARRRRETAREIHLVALRLARDRGFDAVTVEAISAEAGIAPRTFFNYFPTKEAAVVVGLPALTEDRGTAFAAGVSQPRARVLVELVELLADLFTGEMPSRGEMYDVFSVARENPSVFAAMLAQLEAFQRGVGELVARRLDSAADDEVAALIAAMAMTILRSGLDRWMNSAPEPDDDPVRHIARAAALVQEIFAER
jgi:AcrR family transcriptional regulator